MKTTENDIRSALVPAPTVPDDVAVEILTRTAARADAAEAEVARLRAILDAHTAEQPAPELCDVCGGHGMAGHPDSGAVCHRCNGTGAAQPAPTTGDTHE